MIEFRTPEDTRASRLFVNPKQVIAAWAYDGDRSGLTYISMNGILPNEVIIVAEDIDSVVHRLKGGV